jgi:hypothetical protein
VTDFLRKTTHDLFKITEQLAEREIDMDPLNFVRRETIDRCIRNSMADSQMYFDS